jgi:hypothetical protein
MEGVGGEAMTDTTVVMNKGDSDVEGRGIR